MHDAARVIEADSPLPGSLTEFRADPGAHWPAIIVFAVLALLTTAGVVWLIIKPGAVDVARVLTALFLALVGAACVIGAYVFWVRRHRRYRLLDGGLEYFDGRQTHEIAWNSVAEIYEVISSVKLLGLTVDSPQLGVKLVSTEGIGCEIDNNVLGSDTLAPFVSREVNRRLSELARKRLQRRQQVPFGCVRLSEAGIAIEESAPKPWWEVLKDRFSNEDVASSVVQGDYAWQDVRDIRIVPAMRGSRLSEHTKYNELQIRVIDRESPVFVCGIPGFPNFTVFCEVLEQLGRPLTRDA